MVLMLRKALPERLRLLLQEAPGLQTNCARVINAFERRLDRVIPSWRDAEHLVADATAASDYEVLQVYSGAAYTEENEKLFDIYPFYTASDESMPTGEERLDYMSLHRARPIAPPRGRLSSYVGTEAYLRFSGPDPRHAAERLCRPTQKISLSVVVAHSRLSPGAAAVKKSNQAVMEYVQKPLHGQVVKMSTPLISVLRESQRQGSLGPNRPKKYTCIVLTCPEPSTTS